MRVADKMAFDQVNRSISKNRSEMASLQNQAATQKRVNKPSDDPVASTRVLFNRVEQRGIDQYIKNLNFARGFLDFSEQSLSELSEVLVRAKELALSQANDASANAQSRRIVATEVSQLLNQSVQIANRKLGERFIFGGFQTTKAPFSEEGEYHGDDGEMRVHIDKDTFLAMNVPGSYIFEGKGFSKDGVSAHSLAQAKSLPEMEKQKDEFPEKFGKPGNVFQQREREEERSTQVRGPASLRPSEAAAPVQDKPELDGEKLPEGLNVFRTIGKLEISLTTDDKLGIQESLDRIDDALQQVVLARTTLGSRVMAIDNTLNSMNVNNVDSKTSISQLEDADAFQVISDINKTEGALQATLQTSGKLIQKSLMDFIS